MTEKKIHITTVKLPQETVEKMKKIIKDSNGKYRNVSHFIELAIRNYEVK